MNYKLYEPLPVLNIPETNLVERFEESKEIVQKAIYDTDPYAVGVMLSGGTDSLTALQVAIMLGVKIDFIMHGVTGTGLKDCRTFVNQVAAKHNIKLIEADAGTAFEDYVKRKGFFGKGVDAHRYSYHVLKSGPFRKAISKHVRKGKAGRKIIQTANAVSAQAKNIPVTGKNRNTLIKSYNRRPRNKAKRTMAILGMYITARSGAMQIAVIASQPMPKYPKGSSGVAPFIGESGNETIATHPRITHLP